MKEKIKKILGKLSHRRDYYLFFAIVIFFVALVWISYSFQSDDRAYVINLLTSFKKTLRNNEIFVSFFTGIALLFNLIFILIQTSATRNYTKIATMPNVTFTLKSGGMYALEYSLEKTQNKEILKIIQNEEIISNLIKQTELKQRLDTRLIMINRSNYPIKLHLKIKTTFDKMEKTFDFSKDGWRINPGMVNGHNAFLYEAVTGNNGEGNQYNEVLFNTATNAAKTDAVTAEFEIYYYPLGKEELKVKIPKESWTFNLKNFRWKDASLGIEV